MVYSDDTTYLGENEMNRTIYLIDWQRHNKREEQTFAFCSPMCRHRWAISSPRIPSASLTKYQDDHYEFNEICANCGALILAAVSI